MAVAVVDRMGVTHRLCFSDRFAGPHTPGTSERKAWTAVSFRADTLLAGGANTRPESPQSGARHHRQRAHDRGRPPGARVRIHRCRDRHLGRAHAATRITLAPRPASTPSTAKLELRWLADCRRLSAISGPDYHVALAAPARPVRATPVCTGLWLAAISSGLLPVVSFDRSRLVFRQPAKRTPLLTQARNALLVRIVRIQQR